MRQSRLMSLVEAVTNVAVGYGLAVVTQLLVFPMFGLATTLGQNFTIGAIFTLVSLVRGYALRRAFEAILARVGTTPNIDDPLCPSPRATTSLSSTFEITKPDVITLL